MRWLVLELPPGIKVVTMRKGFPSGSYGKESACNAGDLGSTIPGSGRSSGKWNGNPFQYCCLEKSMDRVVGYSPWGHQELDMADRLTLS